MSGGIVFNAPIGKANINTGDGTQVTGDGANVNTGDGTINVGGQTFGGIEAPTVPQVFGELRKAIQLPDSLADSQSPDAVASSEQADDLEEQVVMPLQTLAELPEEELKKPSTIEQAQLLLNQLVPFAPKIGKGLAVFGSAALSALASRNPIISGILAVCNMASDPNKTA